ncbi:glycine betaine ABC transporter substrate-binding protein [Sphingobacterium sp. LRF_L2]|uniref:glycine betaine ABC transporter substrate-binding protein n=1 Tax=Sphingobacterium sp. LRF_L2 TaxID=3369421 RepID=UPI003F62CEB4
MKIKSILLFIVVGVFTMGCQDYHRKRITIGMVNGWAQNEAMTLVAEEILTRQGYHVVIQRASADLIFASMDNGDTDLFMDTWLPETHGHKIARFKKIQSIRVNYENARIGLVVPTYVTIDSIEELNLHREAFQDRIVGIELGAGLTKSTNKAIEDYKLNLNQLNSSSVAMIAELDKAIKERRWIVVSSWKPHWMFASYDLKFLEDPKKSFGDAERIETYARQNFEKEQAEVYGIFQRIYFDDLLLTELLDRMQKNKNKKTVAKEWVDEHTVLVSQWIGS